MQFGGRLKIIAGMQYSMISTRWGPFLAAFNSKGLVRTLLPDSSPDELEDSVRREWPDVKRSRTVLPGLRDAIMRYFSGRETEFDVAIDWSQFGEFADGVMKATRRIPFGRTATYADLARAAGSPRAARAVGTVMSRNPLPLIVPCHRVVRSDGTLGGFSSRDGISFKKRLLAHEGAAT